MVSIQSLPDLYRWRCRGARWCTSTTSISKELLLARAIRAGMDNLSLPGAGFLDMARGHPLAECIQRLGTRGSRKNARDPVTESLEAPRPAAGNAFKRWSLQIPPSRLSALGPSNDRPGAQSLHLGRSGKMGTLAQHQQCSPLREVSEAVELGGAFAAGRVGQRESRDFVSAQVLASPSPSSPTTIPSLPSTMTNLLTMNVRQLHVQR